MQGDIAYDLAAAVAAQIVNTLGEHQGCKADLFGRVLFLCLEGFHRSERFRYERLLIPSTN